MNARIENALAMLSDVEARLTGWAEWETAQLRLHPDDDGFRTRALNFLHEANALSLAAAEIADTLD